MNEDEKKALQDRFSGYQLPKIYLTAGFPSYEVPVHPYFFNQPLEWTKPAYTKYQDTGPQLLEGQYPVQPSGQSESQLPVPEEGQGGSEIAGSSGSSASIIRGSQRGIKKEPPRTNMMPF